MKKTPVKTYGSPEPFFCKVHHTEESRIIKNGTAVQKPPRNCLWIHPVNYLKRTLLKTFSRYSCLPLPGSSGAPSFSA